MAPNNILLILGAGPNIARATADVFAAKGYRIALVSRGRTRFDPAYLHIKSDLAKPDAIHDAFTKVRAAFGAAPNVVIHNAYHVFPTRADNPLSLSQAQLEYDIAINTTSAYAAAAEAVAEFAHLPPELPKSFIYTANGLGSMPQPQLISLGLGKTAMAHVIENAVIAYRGKGWTFYYCDERLEDGNFAAGAINGPAHAEQYWELSQDRQQGEWRYTFVAGLGYKRFQDTQVEL
ncbi:uncharacterized protein K452DRAFT_278106 [Aplosporella prunicola CBS 121167]|uniref:Uncharacterized protein n=1 Tax=Aplosporella prunicola CBS 121167 TaxID=1176127 RepID=A0A6A6B464_9PEZI|nr:uncharacterized protein K452DRAFT_278106 [Aplosporella prunicola CBS 121167]KAF2137747.1 hypothetical protein K452DRAFT_278106 [Aplosporella prunicola CBS 121167]